MAAQDGLGGESVVSTEGDVVVVVVVGIVLDVVTGEVVVVEEGDAVIGADDCSDIFLVANCCTPVMLLVPEGVPDVHVDGLW